MLFLINYFLFYIDEIFSYLVSVLIPELGHHYVCRYPET